MRKTFQPEKLFFEECSWFRLNNLGLALGIALRFYVSVAKRTETKSKKVFGANSYVCRSNKGKAGMGDLF